jgi:hypothetical protein
MVSRRQEVLTIVKIQNVIFWVTILCSLTGDYQHSGETRGLHFQSFNPLTKSYDANILRQPQSKWFGLFEDMNPNKTYY